MQINYIFDSLVLMNLFPTLNPRNRLATLKLNGLRHRERVEGAAYLLFRAAAVWVMRMRRCRRNCEEVHFSLFILL